MRSKALLAASLLFLLAAACSPAAALGDVVLEPGQSAGDASQSVEVTFVEILGDSRCPADAMCVWQGNVSVLIEVAHGTESQQYTLTLGELLEGDVNSITVGEYTITLTQVNPYPLASQPTDPADYRVTLQIA